MSESQTFLQNLRTGGKGININQAVIDKVKRLKELFADAFTPASWRDVMLFALDKAILYGSPASERAEQQPNTTTEHAPKIPTAEQAAADTTDWKSKYEEANHQVELLIADIKIYKADLELAQTRINELEPALARANGALAKQFAEADKQQPDMADASLKDRWDALKEATEKALPIIFNLGDEYPTIPVKDGELLELLIDYCERDPSSEFPFAPIAKAIVERHTGLTINLEEETHEQPTA